MAKANGSRHEADFIKEVTYGVTPATPAMTLIRHNSMTLGLSKDSIQSEEVRSDRQVADIRHGNQQTGGDITGELIYGAHDEFLAAALGGTWATDTPSAGIDQLKVDGSVALPSFTIRRHFEDIAEYQVFTGVKINTFSLSVQPNSIVTMTFGVIGKGMSTSNIAGATQNAANTNTPLAGQEAGTIKEGGSTIAGVTGIELSLANGIEPAFELGSVTTGEPTTGRSNLSGTVTAYFEDQTLLNKFINETESSLEFTMTDLDGNTLRFVIPRLKYMGGQPDVSGDGPVLLSMPIQALYDSSTGTNFYIERNPV